MPPRAPRTDRSSTPRPAARRRLPRLLPVIAVAVTATACYEQILVPDTQTDGRVTITNDEDALAGRLVYVDEEIPVEPPALAMAGAAGAAPQRAPAAVTFRLAAELTPPTIDGEIVQATSVSHRSSSNVLVSYNMRGERFLGGVDIIRNWSSSSPRIVSSIYFDDSDVSAVALGDLFVYAAEATGAEGFATPAAVESLGLTWSGADLAQNARVDLSSFAATSLQAVGGTVYATSGDDGDVYALDPVDLSVMGRYELEDARWVEPDAANGRVVVVQGTPGRISVFRDGSFPGGSMELLDTFPFPGADVPESKSALDIAGGKAFIAAGPEGVQVMCLDSGEIVGSVPRPDPAALGLDPSVVVTNAVTVDDDLMFISNGEAGVYVAVGGAAWEDTACDAPQTITVLGRLQFGSLESVNHVDYRDGVLVVAAGLGGVKFVRVKVRT